ncbi:hypothetical protein [Luteibacter sp. dw_328]|uniref:hypothetical protein n=1 Tax=Luteibacter sp. dw_328 TaxID=2719796 RepID=UPI001BD58AA5|nr:hypothetical protein [Luteibacter sp. dw_328]
MESPNAHITTKLEREVLELVRPLEPVPLLEVLKHAERFDSWGVYMLIEGKPDGLDVGALPVNVVYIGKGIGEGIARRSAKHLANMTGAVNAQGSFKIRTSRAIQAYRERVGHDPQNLWFVAAPMDGVNGSVVSFAEEVLLEQYVRAHGRLPVCNTAGGHLWKPVEPRATKPAGKKVTKGPKRAPVAEDAVLEALCRSIAAGHGLACNIIPMSGPEPRIALGWQGRGRLSEVVFRAMFKPGAREVAVVSKLHPAAVKPWAEAQAHPQPSALKSAFRLPWPVNAEAFEEMVLASVEEARATSNKAKQRGARPVCPRPMVQTALMSLYATNRSPSTFSRKLKRAGDGVVPI